MRDHKESPPLKRGLPYLVGNQELKAVIQYTMYTCPMECGMQQQETIITQPSNKKMNLIN